ncbi:MAG: FAD-dependent oxidoreductase [Chlamydiota bacterium]
MKKAAVIGAGFAGLAIAYHLLSRGIEVDLFDQKGVGAGASGVASGLLHPYAGEQARRSYLADEALVEAKTLIALAQSFSKKPVADFSGVIRKATAAQAKMLLSHKEMYKDVEVLDESTFLITSGIAVHSKRYLEGLFLALQAKGLQWKIQKILFLEELKEYDNYFLALGAGVFAFPELERFSLKPVKGQVLTCKWPLNIPSLEHGLIGKGYVVPLENGRVHVGATYERGLFDEEVDMEKALVDLGPKVKVLVPGWENIEVEGCMAGVRVSHTGHYFPLTEKVGEKGWMLAAMGSRGLLYHGYASKMLVESAIGKGD